MNENNLKLNEMWKTLRDEQQELNDKLDHLQINLIKILECNVDKCIYCDTENIKEQIEAKIKQLKGRLREINISKLSIDTKLNATTKNR